MASAGYFFDQGGQFKVLSSHFKGDDMFKIIKNKKLPPSATVTIYPFRNMKIGDSFFVPIGNDHKVVVRNRICAAYRPSRWKGRKFTTRYIKDEDGIRCWRVK